MPSIATVGWRRRPLRFSWPISVSTIAKTSQSSCKSLRESLRLSDAAILLAAVERWGESCVEKLIGDYAFALWDGAQRRLFLARDPIGQRPLHYHRGNSFFAFASMPKGLHALAAVPYAPDEDGIAEYLLLMPPTGTRTYFRDIERVLPGHIVTVSGHGLSARRHWQPKIRPLRLRQTEEYARRCGTIWINR